MYVCERVSISSMNYVDKSLIIILPEVASILIPNDKIVQEWITSVNIAEIRIGVLNGIMNRLSIIR